MRIQFDPSTMTRDGIKVKAYVTLECGQEIEEYGVGETLADAKAIAMSTVHLRANGHLRNCRGYHG